MEGNIQDIVYHYVCLSSGIICVLLAFFLLDIRTFKQRAKQTCPLLLPKRYIYARISLGIAYIVLGLLTALQVLLDMPNETNTFLPLAGLVIASSQALLFTMSILSFYNSRLANYKMVWGNIIPLALLYILHEGCATDECQQEIRIMWLIVYGIQLVEFSLTFIYARKKYEQALIQNLGPSSIISRYAQNELLPLFIGTLIIGLYALASFFFTDKWSLSIFIIIYTIYYIMVGIYTLRYADKCQSIMDISEIEEE